MTTNDTLPMYIVNVEVAVVRNGRYLAITRAASEPVGAGEVTFPGGKVDLDLAAGDILEQTARREVKEEVGLDLVSPVTYVESHTFGTNAFPVLDVVMLALAGTGDPVLAPEEVERAEWLTFDEMMAHPAVQSWTRDSLRKAERLRQALDW